TEIGAAERVSATNVTPRFFAVLGVAPALGRAFDQDDVGRPVVVVSHAFWRGKLAADPRAIGRSLVLGGQPHTIVGVLPERFAFALNACDLWRPFPAPPAHAIRAGYRVRAIARLARPGAATDLRSALDEVSRGSSPTARAVDAAGGRAPRARAVRRPRRAGRRRELACDGGGVDRRADLRLDLRVAAGGRRLAPQHRGGAAPRRHAAAARAHAAARARHR